MEERDVGQMVRYKKKELAKKRAVLTTAKLDLSKSMYLLGEAESDLEAKREQFSANTKSMRVGKVEMDLVRRLRTYYVEQMDAQNAFMHSHRYEVGREARRHDRSEEQALAVEEAATTMQLRNGEHETNAPNAPNAFNAPNAANAASVHERVLVARLVPIGVGLTNERHSYHNGATRITSVLPHQEASVVGEPMRFKQHYQLDHSMDLHPTLLPTTLETVHHADDISEPVRHALVQALVSLLPYTATATVRVDAAISPYGKLPHL